MKENLLSATPCRHLIEPASDNLGQYASMPLIEKNTTLEEAVTRDLDIEYLRDNYRDTRPSPLDPYRLKIHGQSYVNVALHHVQGRLYRNINGMVIDENVADDIEAEIDTQFRKRTASNGEAMDRFREYASQSANNRTLAPSEAGGIMQVRAGLASVPAVLKLLARVPELGAIEIARATQPCCVVKYDIARRALDETVCLLPSDKAIELNIANDTTTAPYRFNLDEGHGIVMSKRVMARVAIGDTTMEIVTRDSYRGAGAGELDDSVEHLSSMIGPISLDLTPVAFSAYARIAKS